jgi:hypothetical protein
MDGGAFSRKQRQNGTAMDMAWCVILVVRTEAAVIIDLGWLVFRTSANRLVFQAHPKIYHAWPCYHLVNVLPYVQSCLG